MFVIIKSLVVTNVICTVLYCTVSTVQVYRTGLTLTNAISDHRLRPRVPLRRPHQRHTRHRLDGVRQGDKNDDDDDNENDNDDVL